MATILLVDLRIRSHDMLSHYSDLGILPASLWREYLARDWVLSFHVYFADDKLPGVWLFGYLLYGVLLVGYRSRLFAFLSWIYLLSLHGRNPLLLNAGDALLRMLLLWSSLLPIGARWSADARLGRPAPADPYLSFGTVVMVLQVVTIYWVTAYWKIGDVWWGTGNAIQRALEFDLFATGRVDFLKSYPELLRLLTRLTLLFEWIAPAVALFPWRNGWIRCGVVFTFIAFHAGLAWALELGLFSYVCMAAWLPFLPRELWSRLGVGGGERQTELSVAGEELDYGELVRVFIMGLCAVCYLTYSAHSLCYGCFTVPPALERVATVTGLRHQWKMYVNPSATDGWYVALAKTKSGREIDLLSPTGEPAWEKPVGLSARAANHRWRKLFRKLAKSKLAPIYEPLIHVLCRERSDLTAGEEVETVTLYHMLELAPASIMKRSLQTGSCRREGGNRPTQ